MGPPSGEVTEVLNWLGIVCVWVVTGVVTQCGHQGAPRIHPAATFPWFCSPLVVSALTSLHLPVPDHCKPGRRLASSPSLLGSNVLILTFSLSQTTETTTTPHPSCLLAECILQSPLLSPEITTWRNKSVRS